jgi:hypothetical protein
LGGEITPHYESGNPPVWMSKYLLPLVVALDMGIHKQYTKKENFPLVPIWLLVKKVFQDYGLFNIELGLRGSKGLEGRDKKDKF